MDQTELNAFLERQRIESAARQLENERIDVLIKRFKLKLPNTSPVWDRSSAAVHFNDIGSPYIQAGLAIYDVTMQDLWQGLYEPCIYEKDTIWSKEAHDIRKIALVLEAWEANRALSPIFLIRMKPNNLALVADGKHRLTVSRALQAESMVVMVSLNDEAWLGQLMPSARRVAVLPPTQGQS